MTEAGKSRRPVWIVLITSIGVLLVGVVLFQLIFYERYAWTQTVTFDGQTVDVKIWHVRRRSFIQLGHDFLVGGGGDKFTTRIRYREGRSIKFETSKQPRAIWKLDGELYIACCNGNWLVGRLDDLGNIVPISRDELPRGVRAWNLESQEPDVQASWDTLFEAWE